MKTVSIKQAAGGLSALVRAAEKGETITLTRNGAPVAEIKPVKKKNYAIDWDAGEAFLNKLGADRIASWISPDFDDPLPEDLLTPLPADFGQPKKLRKK